MVTQAPLHVTSMAERRAGKSFHFLFPNSARIRLAWILIGGLTLPSHYSISDEYLKMYNNTCELCSEAYKNPGVKTCYELSPTTWWVTHFAFGSRFTAETSFCCSYEGYTKVVETWRFGWISYTCQKN